MMFFKTDVQAARTNWPRVEKYQNSTLRFSPGEDFPAHLEKMIGRPRIMRCFLTLYDAWDYRTGEYIYDFVVGSDRYSNDSTMPLYDRDETKHSPYGITYLKHLSTHAAHADEIMLSIRGYEREVKRGKISIDKYEEVLENLLEYYKELVPNIRCLECNEVNWWQFGDMTAFEFYELYKRHYRIVNRLNARHNYTIPLAVGGPCFVLGNRIDKDNEYPEFTENEQFLRLYALDPSPEKRIDFYSTHRYGLNTQSVPKYYNWIKKMIKKLDLPDRPVHIDEFGMTAGCSPDPKINQLNAAKSLEVFFANNDKPDLFLYPWCSYHDPDIQVDRSQYVDFKRTTGYLPTFLGQAYIALSKLLDYRLPTEGNVDTKAIVTTDGKKYAVLATNSGNERTNIRFILDNLQTPIVTIKEYRVDALHNNVFIDHSIDDLKETGRLKTPVINGAITVEDSIDAMGFTLWIIE